MSVVNRLARREIAAHRGRSWLIAVLIAMPVLTATASSVWLTSTTGTPERAVAQQLGRFQTRVDAGLQPTPERAARLASLHAELGGTAEQVGVVSGELHGHPVDFGLVTADVTDPRFQGRWVVDGGLPGDAVLLSRDLASSLGVRKGDEVTLDGASYPVGGTFIVTALDWAGVPGVAVAPTHPLAEPGLTTLFLPERLLDAEAEELATAGLMPVTADFVADNVGHPNPGLEILTVVFTVLGALVVASVAAAAFAIGVRGQRRTLALLAATGAPPRLLKTVLVRGGVLLGVLGAVLGVAGGLLVGAALAALGNLRTPVPGFGIVVGWLQLALFAGIGVAAAWLAAWWPSRGVARADVVVALGQAEAPMPSPRAPWRALPMLLLGGAALWAGVWKLAAPGAEQAGSTEIGVAISSAVAMVCWFIAAVLAAPWLVERLSRWLPGRWLSLRLALRDAARSGGRAVALVAAVASVVTLGSWAMIYASVLGGDEVRHYQFQGPPGILRIHLDLTSATPSFEQGAVRAAVVADVLGDPSAQVEVSGPLESVGHDGSDWYVSPGPAGDGAAPQYFPVLVGGPDLMELILGRQPSAEAVAALADGAAVVFGEASLRKDRAVLTETSYGGADPTSIEHALPGVVAGEVPGVGAVVAPETAAALGMNVAPQAIWLRYDQALTDADLARAKAAVDALGGNYILLHEQGPHSAWLAGIPLALGTAGLLAVVVAVIAMALSIQEGRSVRTSLATLGAEDALLRRVAVAQSVVCVALGAVLGLLAGALPSILGFMPTNFPVARLPWSELAILAVGPALAVAAAAAVLVRPTQGRMVQDA